MTTDLDTVLSQKRELDRLADDLREARSRLIRHRNSLNRDWAATEIQMINDAIDRINRRLNGTADDLNDIGTDMIKVYRDLEEQERIEREQAEAKAREEQEAKAAAARREAAEKSAPASDSQGSSSRPAQTSQASAGAELNRQAAQIKDTVSGALNSAIGAFAGWFKG